MQTPQEFQQTSKTELFDKSTEVEPAKQAKLDKINAYLDTNPNIPSKNIHFVEFPSSLHKEQVAPESINYEMVIWDGASENVFSLSPVTVQKITHELHSNKLDAVIKTKDYVGRVMSRSEALAVMPIELLKNLQDECADKNLPQVEDVFGAETINYSSLKKFYETFILLQSQNRQAYICEVKNQKENIKHNKQMDDLFRSL